MSNPGRRSSSFLAAWLLAAISACGPSAGDGNGSGATEADSGPDSTTGASLTSTSGPGDSAATGTTAGPVTCPEGETPCGDECVDLLWSEEHCGACDRACQVVGGVGECWEGECPPTAYCAMADQGLETCAEVCASYGQTCIDTDPAVPGSCGGEFYGLFYEVSASFDCEAGFFASSLMMGGCSDAIRWDHVSGPNGGSLPDAVSCCCTQP